MEKTVISERLKSGGLCYFITTLLFTIQLFCYICNSNVIDNMDFIGWVFYLSSCISQASTFALFPFIVLFLPACISGHPKIGIALMCLGETIISVLLFLNMQIYNIYRFHINGFVLNLVFGGNAGEIFTFDSALYMKEAILLTIFVGICVSISVIAWKKRILCKRRTIYTAISCILACTVFSHGYHIYASYIQKPSVIKSRSLIPYYFPTTSTSLMAKLNIAPVRNGMENFKEASGDAEYPKNPIKYVLPDSVMPNIVMIMIDSWNRRTLTPECMPETYRYAERNEWYDNHFSGSNGTRSSIFGIFFSVPSYYWYIFEADKTSPVFIDQMLSLGYTCRIYPSATITEPPFDRVIFHRIPNLNTSTDGENVYERDHNLTDNFINDLDSLRIEGKPFFSFLFYDLPHSFEIPSDKLNTFSPSWKFADYTKLDNDLDPTGFFNLYRNCCHEDDILIGNVLNAIDKAGIADNTIVIISGDHSQEFNENHKNYWGHNSNYSQWQIRVPLICHIPGRTARKYSHRTTHYDIIPTIMTHALGVQNPTSDYSFGHVLSDSIDRGWIVAGSELNYAFIIPGDTILEKAADGSMCVYDRNMNCINDYRLNASEFNNEINKFNHFLK